MLLKQHLGRQTSQPWPAPAAERQILQHLPGELLQLSFAGQRGQGRTPRRTPQPAGGGSRARPQLECGAQSSQRPSGGLVSPLRRPPTMRRAGAEPVQELVAASPPRCSLPWQQGERAQPVRGARNTTAVMGDVHFLLLCFPRRHQRHRSRPPGPCRSLAGLPPAPAAAQPGPCRCHCSTSR